MGQTIPLSNTVLRSSVSAAVLTPQPLSSVLASRRGTEHDAEDSMKRMELQTGKLMTERTPAAERTTPIEQPSQEFLPRVDLGMSIRVAAIISIVSAIVVALSSYEVVKGTQSAGVTRTLAVVALLALVAFVYGLIELALAVIATTAERRRKAREVTERRKGERARKPTPH
jgi:hypothetical protein